MFATMHYKPLLSGKNKRRISNIINCEILFANAKVRKKKKSSSIGVVKKREPDLGYMGRFRDKKKAL